MRRNTHSPSSEGTFLIHTPLSSTVHLRIEAKGPVAEAYVRENFSVVSQVSTLLAEVERLTS